jgi:hypothetical protein
MRKGDDFDAAFKQAAILLKTEYIEPVDTSDANDHFYFWRKNVDMDGLLER